MWNHVHTDEYGGVRWYRSAEEIRADMRRIAEKVREVKERFDVRDMAVTALAESANAKAAAGRMLTVLADARESLLTLRALEAELEALREELTGLPPTL